MEHSGSTWGMRKHRQGGHGKNASPPSRYQKWRVKRDWDRAAREEVNHRVLQEFEDAKVWLHRHSR